MALDPLLTTEKVVSKYIDYLTTTFSFKDKTLQEQLVHEFKKKKKFYRDPILEATPPFKQGKSLKELIKEGVLSKEFQRIYSKEIFPLDRKLFLHQEQAIRKVVLNHRNIVVATGTGSGKTEAFLIPVFNHLFQQYEDNKLNPGVRALLLYPMNALANDQLKRMRKVLKNCSLFTFGSYTGETIEDYKTALDRYQKMNQGEYPLDNELISREQMKNTPPHILLTNYAMLEYLMLRPDDHTFFDGKYALNWKFIVLDEAHTYSGAKAIEMSMLLRRLKARVIKENTSFKCIATSATLGGGESDFPEVADFATKLFDEPFYYDENDRCQQDVVKAQKHNMNVSLINDSWGEPDVSLYKEWKNVIEQNDNQKDLMGSLIRVALDNGVPGSVVEVAEEKAANNWKIFIYHILKDDKRVVQLQILLEKHPQYLEEVSNDLFDSYESAVHYLTDLVFLANRAKIGEEQQPLIPARYHLFIRSIEGAYLSFLPDKKLFLERLERRRIDNKEYPVFEVAICQQCSSLYLVGERQLRGDHYYFFQPGRKYFEDRGNLDYFLVLDEESTQVMDNEDELIDTEDNTSKENNYSVCPSCGNIKLDKEMGGHCKCNCNRIKLLKVKTKEGLVHKCPACGNKRTQGSIVWRFMLGGDAVTSVLATALYQQLPEKKEEINKETCEDTDMPWGHKEVAAKKEVFQEEGGRQLLIFSDSRQDAAFFATFFQSTYQQIVRRQLIIKLLRESKESILSNEWTVKDLAVALKNFLAKQKHSNLSRQEIEDLSWKWVFYEFLAIDRKHSLEAMGLLGFILNRPNNFIAPPLMEAPWNLSLDEAWVVFQILMDTVRKYGAVTFPEAISPEDEFFEPKNREYFFKESMSVKNKIFSWNPTQRWVLNSRMDYLLRLGDRVNSTSVSREECADLLKDIWIKGLAIMKPRMFKDYFSTIPSPTEGPIHQIKYEQWKIISSIISDTIQWYHCAICNRITLYNVRGVCPSYCCTGTLKECNLEDIFSSNHYRNLYLDSLPLKMETSEHTAQLTTEAAAEIQNRFNEREINVLSCSTTFELGVDVGDLESVFMRNVPPTPANYIQRAGRAGRRTDSTAFSLTFARRKSHDLTYFNEPLEMVSGKVKPPHFVLRNPKIVERHIYATVLSFFWKKHPQYFANVSNFFFSDGVKGIDRFYSFIQNHPSEVKDYLERIIPKALLKDFQINEWGWLDGLIGSDGVLTKANLRLSEEISKLEMAQENYAKQKNYGRAGAIKRVVNTIKKKYLLTFMSQNNIIPKYGFPVDVVDLRIEHHGEIAKSLDLNRDLSIALSEYAPESQVVAGGRLWKSRYLKRLPNRALIKYKYAICDECGYYQSSYAELGDDFSNCRVCGVEIGKKRGFFVVPEFGFISEKPVKPKMRRPEKTYSTRRYFTGEYDDISESIRRVNLKEANVELIAANQGKMAIINHAGLRHFSICQRCGHAEINSQNVTASHDAPWGHQKCKGKRSVLSLGYEFYTDILQIRFEVYDSIQYKEGFWESILYGLLEGVGQALGIERGDIDGCLYPYKGDYCKTALILYDSVPGGAGHVKRIVEKNNFKDSLEKTLSLVDNCQCGGKEGDSSCYGCLRKYNNEYCHDILKRGYVSSFVKILVRS